MTTLSTVYLMTMEQFSNMNVTSLWFELLNGYSDDNLCSLLQAIRKKYIDLYSEPHCTVPLPGQPAMKRLVILLKAVTKHQRRINIAIVACELIQRLVNSEGALHEFVLKGLPEALVMVVRSLTDISHGDSPKKPTMSLRFQLLEASTKLLLRLCVAGRSNSNILDVLLTENTAAAMLSMIDCDKSFVFHYSPEASHRLEVLTCGKTLICQRVRLGNADLQDKYRHYFGENHDKIVTPNRGYVVTLFDTTDPSKDVVISDEMLSSKLVWPKDKSESTVIHRDTDWVDIKVQCAFGGTSFWAQFPNDDSMQTIDAALQEFFSTKNSSHTLKHKPMVGAFVCGERPVIGVYRAQVVSTNEATATVFAFDYGSLFVVQWNDLIYITGELDQKVEPQAVPCQLQGVRPAAYIVGLVVDAVAVLCNLSAHVKATTLRIPCCACLVPLCWCPHPRLAAHTLRFLSNLAWDQCHRVFLATPFIEVGLAVCQRLMEHLREPEMSGVVESALTLLNNLIYDCPENIQKLNQMDGLHLLLTLIADSTPFVVREAALKVLRCYVGDGPAPSSLMGARRRIRRGSRSNHHTAQSSNHGNTRHIGSSRCHPIRSSPDSESDTGRRRRSLQRRRSNSLGRSISRTRRGSDGRICAVARIDHQDSSSDDGFHSGRPRSTDGILGSMPATEGHLEEAPVKTQYVNMAELHSSQTRYYVKDNAVDITDDETHEIRMNTRLQDVTSTPIADIVCSYLNSGDSGTIYFGLRKASGPQNVRVSGIQASRDQRDSFRMGVDKQVIGTITPVVTALFYDIAFHPVVLLQPPSEQMKVLPDLFVIELHVKSVVGSAFVTNGRYFVRDGNKSICLHSQQKIHEWLVKKEEQPFLKEMSSLSEELEHLRRLVTHRNSASHSPKHTSLNQFRWSSDAPPPGGSRVEE